MPKSDIPKRDPELDRLRRENEQLRKAHAAQPVVTRRARALSALTALTSAKPELKGEVILPPLTPPLRLGRQMGAAIAAEIRAMAIECRAMVRELSKSPVGAMDAPPDGSNQAEIAQQQLDALKTKWQQKFEVLADSWSKRMIGDVTAQSTAQLTLGLREMGDRMAIQSTMQTPRMRSIVRASVSESVGLITAIPERYLGGVRTAVMRAVTSGAGLSELVPLLTKHYHGDARRALLTSLDQIRKTTAAVNATRLQSLGVTEFIWVHTGGEKYPRPLHESYSGKTFSYADPPVIDKKTGERGIPGQAYNCRCVARPKLDFSKMREAL